MRKKALLALLMVLTLALTSCSLIVKDEEVDGATEILRLGDQVVTKKEVQSAINYQANYTASLYNSIGYSIDPSDPDFLADIRESVVGTLRQNMVVNAKAAELGYVRAHKSTGSVIVLEERNASRGDGNDFFWGNVDVADFVNWGKTGIIIVSGDDFLIKEFLDGLFAFAEVDFDWGA